MTADTMLATVSALAAIIAAIAAWRSNIISRRALKLAESDFALREKPLSLYLMDGFRYVAKDERASSSILGFSLSITNTSTCPNSIVSFELHVDCLTLDNRRIEYVLPHNSALRSSVPGDLTPFDCPILLGPKESKSRWALFAESAVIPSEVRRDSYRVIVIDANGCSASVTKQIVSEMDND